ncbi:MAG: FecR domain-containing protein [Nitrospiraceae bacterium]|nr:FecR domain-containing protein [Nitrospiraceae bacterium]
MKRFGGVLVLMVVLLAPALAVASQLGDLRVSLISGDVQFRNEDTGGWVPLSVNTPLREGDRVWVPEGARAELTLRDGTRVRLDEFSALDVVTVERDSSQFYLSEGSVYVYYRGPGDSVLQLDTPVASIRVYDPTNFMLDSSERGGTEISVIRGEVYAESPGGSTRVPGGSALLLREGEAYADLTPLGGVDAWERWNRDRDEEVYGKNYSTRYLPDELAAYSYDFDENGRWIRDRDYGYVWVPTTGVSAGWAPYQDGRWTLINGDYVWVGYEPWGWAPYHYGRWIWNSSSGWCWVPPQGGSVYWAPGYVGWVKTPEYVSWVPLAPGEVYYGYGNYGPNSFNLSINVFSGARIPRYRNAAYRHGVRIVRHDSFYKGKYAEMKPGYNPFEDHKRGITFGRPAVKHDRSAAVPVFRESRFRTPPPKTVNELKVREIRKERPFVKEKTRSVFSRGAAPDNLPVNILKERPSRERQRQGGAGGGSEIRDHREPPVTKMEEQRRQNPMYQQQKMNEAHPGDRNQPKAVDRPQNRPADLREVPQTKKTPEEERGVQHRQSPALDQQKPFGERPADKSRQTRPVEIQQRPSERQQQRPLEIQPKPIEKQQQRPIEKQQPRPGEKQQPKPIEKQQQKPVEKQQQKTDDVKTAPDEKKPAPDRMEEQRRQNPMYQQQK